MKALKAHWKDALPFLAFAATVSLEALGAHLADFHIASTWETVVAAVIGAATRALVEYDKAHPIP